MITVRAIMWINKIIGGPKKYILPKMAQRKFKLTWVYIRAKIMSGPLPGLPHQPKLLARPFVSPTDLKVHT